MGAEGGSAAADRGHEEREQRWELGGGARAAAGTMHAFGRSTSSVSIIWLPRWHTCTALPSALVGIYLLPQPHFNANRGPARSAMGFPLVMAL
jgi:hypothetical protein